MSLKSMGDAMSPSLPSLTLPHPTPPPTPAPCPPYRIPPRFPSTFLNLFFLSSCSSLNVGCNPWHRYLEAFTLFVLRLKTPLFISCHYVPSYTMC